MIIDLDDVLRLSKFRKIVALINRGKIIKVEINGRYYDISQIIDERDRTIFEVSGVDKSEIIKTNSLSH